MSRSKIEARAARLLPDCAARNPGYALRLIQLYRKIAKNDSLQIAVVTEVPTTLEKRLEIMNAVRGLALRDDE